MRWGWGFEQRISSLILGVGWNRVADVVVQPSKPVPGVVHRRGVDRTETVPVVVKFGCSLFAYAYATGSPPTSKTVYAKDGTVDRSYPG